MTHGQPHEEAEHAAHHAADPFDRRVAMTMVVVAALLAGVKVQGHRTHNDTLAYQIKSNIAHTQESDQWNFFQSKKMREVMARLEAMLLLQNAEGGAPRPAPVEPADKEKAPPEKKQAVLKNKAERQKAIQDDIADLVSSLEREPTEQKVGTPAEEAARIVAKGEKRFAALVAKGIPASQADAIVSAEMTSERYRSESRVIGNYANKKHKAAKDYRVLSDHKHHQAYFFDAGELGVELALVLCSVAILTKRPPFWYGGMGIGAVGMVVVALGFLAH